MAICEQCGADFEIKSAHKEFYQKIGVPEPRLCPLHRRTHLVCWRNQRNLYARTCDKHGEQIISCFAPGTPYTVYDRDYWWSDQWDPLDYGREIDFTKPFGEQYDALLKAVPMVGIFNAKSENSAYCNHVGQTKDCYLTFASWETENDLYSDMIQRTKDSMDLLEGMDVENCYQLVSCNHCYNTKFSIHSERCTDSWFLFDCKNCSNCIGSTGLRNKEYYIFNQPYSPVEYEKKVKELRLDTRSGIEAVRQEFLSLKSRAIHRYADIINSENSIGNFLTGAQNTDWGFNFSKVQDSAFCINGLEMKEVYEGYGVGAVFERGYMVYDAGIQGRDIYWSGVCWSCQYCYFSYNCHSSYEIFGCSGLRGKKFCILNKQYSEVEYKILKAKLIEHMKQTGEWGEFLKPAYSPFGYNETLAQEYEPLTKEEALAKGFNWQDFRSGTYGRETMTELPETIHEVTDTILKETLVCSTCKKNFKITAPELKFYKTHQLPLPTECPETRYFERLSMRDPHYLWKRQCTCGGVASTVGDVINKAEHVHGQEACPNEIETVFNPSRPEAVYCDQCYLAEIG